MSDSLLEVQSYAGEGYQPLIDFGAWRVAVLRYHAELLPENISEMQRHDETDEVFVLLAGRCMLFLGEGADQVTDVLAVDMEPLKLYNVKRGAWHSHTLSHDATVLIVENQDTVLENSPKTVLSLDQRKKLRALAGDSW
ncbi:MAG: hypothetical protein HY866_14435 [Chloroflexi bacterium]|nr:hypothetical protein [Chloroflexota bacterium]